MPTARTTQTRIESEALLLRFVAYRDSDVIATFFTRTDGKIGAIVPAGRKSARRVGGAMEPMHTLHVSLEDRGRELGTLKEARVVVQRFGLVGDLDALDAAGTALRWLRHVCPPRIPEPRAWDTVTGLLDTLDARQHPPRSALAIAALRLLADVGYALEFEHCVRCGRGCPPGKPAFIDAARGGLICQSCGGAPARIGGELRARAADITRGEEPELTDEDAEELLVLVDAAMRAHAGGEG
ncbi:DNA repair protein RecO [Pendulispora albinea]|uniref:DNA repair protein RecO n=1 Tax=Pendulispora albinea TaxID=2741071 RepID=A0ABZ2MBL1_9BACT